MWYLVFARIPYGRSNCVSRSRATSFLSITIRLYVHYIRSISYVCLLALLGVHCNSGVIIRNWRPYFPSASWHISYHCFFVMSLHLNHCLPATVFLAGEFFHCHGNGDALKKNSRTRAIVANAHIKKTSAHLHFFSFTLIRVKAPVPWPTLASLALTLWRRASRWARRTSRVGCRRCAPRLRRRRFACGPWHRCTPLLQRDREILCKSSFQSCTIRVNQKKSTLLGYHRRDTSLLQKTYNLTSLSDLLSFSLSLSFSR